MDWKRYYEQNKIKIWVSSLPAVIFVVCFIFFVFGSLVGLDLLVGIAGITIVGYMFLFEPFSGIFDFLGLADDKGFPGTIGLPVYLLMLCLIVYGILSLFQKIQYKKTN